MKMKVELVVPEWANWMAQDRSGMWYFYQTKPKYVSLFGGWYHEGEFDFAYKSEPPKDWTQELYRLEWS